MEAAALAEFFSGAGRAVPCLLGSAKADVGHAGAAAGMAALVKTCLSLYHAILPPLRNLDRPRLEFRESRWWRLPRHPQFWLHDRAEGPRRAAVSSFSVDGNCVHVVLESFAASPTESGSCSVRTL